MIYTACQWIDNAPFLVLTFGWLCLGLAFIAGLLVGLSCKEVKDDTDR